VEVAAVVAANGDRVGLGFRPELAASILLHLPQIDALEIIAETLFDAPRARLRSFRHLARQVPVHLHGVSLGLASAAPLAKARLDALVRVSEAVCPAGVSEHLAFVRAAGREIGHLAAPPRTAATLEGAYHNHQLASRALGRTLALENVASLIEPPASEYTECEWLLRVQRACDADLLLDLHNLHANALNFSFDARGAIEALPLHRVHTLHLAGGRWVTPRSGRRRWADDHRHAVPEQVLQLLECVAARAPHPLTVFIERDGAYPPFAQLLAELTAARAALAAGRARQAAQPTAAPRRCLPALRHCAEQPAVALEAFLASLYVDATLREHFLRDALSVARDRGLSEEQADALACMDRDGLELFASQLLRKSQGAT
jgi:uncharacterized protein